ncbi:GNAT family N-acetyltransferase [Corticicoccus populi]|uniref:GNAT family N-acetyltransferase n=1 Tax=Corticicoccus populi TaxID=1812821 RepID=A0ABW5WVG3_9STAP
MVEVGYGILPEFQNNGYATEAVLSLIEMAFENNEAEVIHAECRADNIASIKVLKKLNMNLVHREKNMLYWSLTSVGTI